MPGLLVPSKRIYATRYGQKGVLFGRKPWDNPAKYKLNRAYGSEFDFANFTELTRRFQVRNAVAADFDFKGGLEWLPTSNSSALYEALPAGDFEAVLEYSPYTLPRNIFPSIAMLDAAGTGVAIGANSDNNMYNIAMTTWSYSATGNNAPMGSSGDGRRQWLTMRRTGSNITGRFSNDGSTFLGPMAAIAVGTPVYLAISCPYSGEGAQLAITLHRLNIYPGPTFFPG